MKRSIPLRRIFTLAIGWTAALASVGSAVEPDAGSCEVAVADYCVCCPPSDCRQEKAFCPGGVAGLVVLKAQHPECAVNYDVPAAPGAAGTSCQSGGVVASERRSALGVYAQGQNARIDLTKQQLDELVGQMKELRR
jgi:hypothetical protein